MNDLPEKRTRLITWFGQISSCAVAFSGGVDSALVAKAAAMTLGDHAVAVTGVSDSLARGELEQARETAAKIGIRHVAFDTREFEKPAYVANAPDRCFHCKSELYETLTDRLGELGVSVVLNGANVDDLGDYRPGLRAAANYAVRSPLAESGLAKSDVRQLAAHWKLPVWDKPASPCLASRVAYGLEVTPERLRRVDLAEQCLREEEGFAIVRVRYHAGDLARVEVPLDQLDRLCEAKRRERVVRRLLEIGFRSVTIDPAGFRSGSLNESILIELKIDHGKLGQHD